MHSMVEPPQSIATVGAALPTSLNRKSWDWRMRWHCNGLEGRLSVFRVKLGITGGWGPGSRNEMTWMRLSEGPGTLVGPLFRAVGRAIICKTRVTPRCGTRGAPLQRKGGLSWIERAENGIVRRTFGARVCRQPQPGLCRVGCGPIPYAGVRRLGI